MGVALRNRRKPLIRRLDTIPPFSIAPEQALSEP